MKDKKRFRNNHKSKLALALTLVLVFGLVFTNSTYGRVQAGTENEMKNDGFLSDFSAALLNENDAPIETSSFEETLKAKMYGVRYDMSISAENLKGVGNTGKTYTMDFSESQSVFSWGTIPATTITARVNGEDYVIGTYSMNSGILTVKFSTELLSASQLSSLDDIDEFENVYIQESTSIKQTSYNDSYVFKIPGITDPFTMNLNVTGNENPSTLPPSIESKVGQYDEVTGKIKWTVKVKNGGLTYDNPVYLKDLLKKQILVTNSVDIDGSTRTLTQNADKNAFYVDISTLQDGKYKVAGEQTIVYETVPTDEAVAGNTCTIENTAQLITSHAIGTDDDVEIGTEKTTSLNLDSEWMKKTGKYNPEKNSIEWKSF